VSKGGSLLRAVGHRMRNRRAVRQGTRPPAIFFGQELRWALGRDQRWLEETAAEYRDTPAAWEKLSGLRSPSRATDGPAKSMDVAEGFAAWALIKHCRPRVVAELGTQHGISARLWKEALKAYVPDHELILCDLEDRRRFIGDDEATFLEGDARQTLRKTFERGRVDLLFNDAHPIDLIRWSVREGLKQGVPVFAFHDVGHHHPRGPFKPSAASVAETEKLAHGEEYGTYGTWERHVMAEIFDPRLLHDDSLEAGGHRVQFFDSLFGFGVVLTT
jgi:hypothetical protein